MTQPIQPHPAYKRLLSYLKKARKELETDWQGPVYRCVELEWARPEYLISGEGTRHKGSRWMQPNYCKAVHAASTETIALKESRRVYDYYGILKPRYNPRVRAFPVKIDTLVRANTGAAQGAGSGAHRDA